MREGERGREGGKDGGDEGGREGGLPMKVFCIAEYPEDTASKNQSLAI
jgi:hypothetical protein